LCEKLLKLIKANVRQGDGPVATAAGTDLISVSSKQGPLELCLGVPHHISKGFYYG
jgi:hypothetical protein